MTFALFLYMRKIAENLQTLNCETLRNLNNYGMSHELNAMIYSRYCAGHRHDDGDPRPHGEPQRLILRRPC